MNAPAPQTTLTAAPLPTADDQLGHLARSLADANRRGAASLVSEAIGKPLGVQIRTLRQVLDYGGADPAIRRVLQQLQSQQ